MFRFIKAPSAVMNTGCSVQVVAATATGCRPISFAVKGLGFGGLGCRVWDLFLLFCGGGGRGGAGRGGGGEAQGCPFAHAETPNTERYPESENHIFLPLSDVPRSGIKKKHWVQTFYQF